MPIFADFIKGLFGDKKPIKKSSRYEENNFAPELIEIKEYKEKPIEQKKQSEVKLEKYVAFDIEIAKMFEGDFNDWKAHRPLGITCAATLVNGCEPYLWFSRTQSCEFADKMRREDAANLVKYLDEMVRAGYQILTWNGLGFDFDVLAEESGCWEICRTLALNHVDMMFHFFCLQGYTLGLNKAAKGMGLAGKTEGMSGDLAPVLWQQGQQTKVLEYVAQDVRTTLDVAKSVDQTGCINWTSNKGKSQRVNFPDGWLTVNLAKHLPLPDTSWMTAPLKREGIFLWTQPNQAPKHNPTDDLGKPARPVEAGCERSQPGAKIEQPILSEDTINAFFTACDSNSERYVESHFQNAEAYCEEFEKRETGFSKRPE